MAAENRMVSALCWVKRGVAKEMPDRIELEPEQIAELMASTHAKMNAMDGDDEESGDNDECDNDDDMGDVSMKNTTAAALASVGVESVPKGSTSTNNNDDDDPLADFNLDNYDDEDDDDEAVIPTSGPLKGLAVYASNSNDPYITLPDEEDNEDIEDFRIRDTDNLLLVGITEDDRCVVEVNVYEEEEHNMFVHHDVLLSSFPLCMEWLDYEEGESSPGNYIAVGTMQPDIEIWDLDVIDPLEPVCVLASGEKDGSRKKKTTTVSSGHSSAVMGLSWNAPNRNLLASSSADTTVKLWDLSKLTPVHTYTHHDDKVQAVLWNPSEATVLATGSFDRSVAVFDSRQPDAVARWSGLDSDVECLIWDHFNPTYLLTSTESGFVYCSDARMLSAAKPVFTLAAHGQACSSISLSRGIPGLLVTGSPEAPAKVWDIRGQKPSFVLSKDLKSVGGIYSVNFSPDAPWIVAVGGSKGTVKAWDLEDSAIVKRRFASDPVEFSTTEVDAAMENVENDMAEMTVKKPKQHPSSTKKPSSKKKNNNKKKSKK